MAVDDAFTVALLHMNGTDGSTTFTDEAGTTWTPVANAQIDTAQKVFGTGSALFDGTGDYISAPDSNVWILDDGSNSNLWTIDLRLRFNVDPGTGIGGICGQTASTSSYWFFAANNNNLNFRVRTSNVTVVDINCAWNPASATWYHVAVVKNGTSGYMMFIDGTQIGSTTTDTDPMSNVNAILTVGRIGNGSTNFDLNGWIDEFRISKGVARWTANFTPPTYEYGTIQSGGNFFLMF